MMKSNRASSVLSIVFTASLFSWGASPGASLAGPPIPDPVGLGSDECWSGPSSTGIPCFTDDNCSGSQICMNNNRYLSFTPPSSDSVGGAPLAIRVKLVDLPNFSAFNGEVRWVGAPEDSPLARDPSAGTFKTAQLECEPVLLDWGAAGVLYAHGSEIVPDSVYEVQVATADCLALNEEWCFSPPVTIPTNAFGALTGANANFGAMVIPMAAFSDHPAYISPKYRAQMALPEVSPQNAVTVLDILWGQEAFFGFPYPPPGPFACPRPFVGCGDGLVIPPEECDDGNTENGDGCDSTCRWEDRSIVVSIKPVPPTAPQAEPYPPGTVLNGNEILLPHGGVRVFLEVTFANWDPDQSGEPLLGAWQIALDDSGFTSGTAGTLAPAAEECPSEGTCADHLGEGSGCWTYDGYCTAGFFAQSGPGTAVLSMVHVVDRSFGGYRYAVIPFDFQGHVDPGTDVYAATLVLDIPEDALGTFAIDFLKDYPHTFITEWRATNRFPPPYLPIAEYRPAVITIHNERNRYLNFTPRTPDGAEGEPFAVRVKVIDAPQFPAMNGQIYWAGEPSEVSDGSSGPPVMTSPLQLTANVREWVEAEIIAVYGQAVVPGSTYEIRSATEACITLGVEECLSDPLILRTARWGDVVAPWDGTGQPDFADISALVAKFSGQTGAVSFTRADLDPAVPNRVISFSDISVGINAFRGDSYPHAAP